MFPFCCKLFNWTLKILLITWMHSLRAEFTCWSDLRRKFSFIVCKSSHSLENNNFLSFNCTWCYDCFARWNGKRLRERGQIFLNNVANNWMFWYQVTWENVQNILWILIYNSFFNNCAKYVFLPNSQFADYFARAWTICCKLCSNQLSLTINFAHIINVYYVS